MAEAQSAVPHFSGTIDRVTMTDLVQLVCLAQMSQNIAVESTLGRGGICVRSGHVLHALLKGVEGEEAFFELLRWKSGAFVTIPTAAEIKTPTINRTWEFLLIEAIRYRNEKARSSVPEQAFEAQDPVIGFSGLIRGFQLADLVQLACMARTDHMFDVQTDAGRSEIYVRGGQVYHSTFGDLQGEDAFCEILLADTGQFRALAPPEVEIAETIAKPWEYLLMDAMRHRDEKCGIDDEEAMKAAQETIFQRLQRMKVTEKIRLAMTGDKEARTLLIRDSNRMVQYAIICNPRITDGEIASIAASRAVDEEVLRRIAGNREWLRSYPVRLSLATNPKCPFPVATKLIQGLNSYDIKHISKSKSVPASVAQFAKRLVRE